MEHNGDQSEAAKKEVTRRVTRIFSPRQGVEIRSSARHSWPKPIQTQRAKNLRLSPAALNLFPRIIALILASVPVLTASVVAQQAQKPALTRIWAGEEMWQFGGKQHKGDPAKSWRLIPGSKLTLTYSGTGPLPKPVEFVIPLEKPLPLGTVYYLSVKNWYVGKMEATLGDITQALETPRYDWTPVARFEPNAPVDKITLRYFPSTLVADTGKAQEQPYVVQGRVYQHRADPGSIRGR